MSIRFNIVTKETTEGVKDVDASLSVSPNGQLIVEIAGIPVIRISSVDGLTFLRRFSTAEIETLTKLGFVLNKTAGMLIVT